MKKIGSLLSVGILLILSAFYIADDAKPMLLLNATFHLGNGENLPNSAIAFNEQEMLFMADATTAKIDIASFQLLSIPQMHIYAIELVDASDSKIFSEEFSNLISLYSSRDSVATAKVFHKQLTASYFEEKRSPSFIVINKEWNNAMPFKLLYVFIDGKMVKSPAME
jgi:hypothetical protein